MALLVLKKGYSQLAVWRTTTLPAGNNALSSPIDIRGIDGYLSAGWIITGTGTVRFEILSCLDGTNYLDLSGDIAAAQTATSGPDANGKNGASIVTVPAPFIKIRMTETVGANAAVVSFFLYGN
jgi:hypothetical protein